MAEAPYTIKKGANYPPYEPKLTNKGAPVNLTEAKKITVFMTAGATKIEGDTTGTVTVVNAPAGEIAFKWTTGQTAVAGSYKVEVEVEWMDKSITFFPNSGSETVVIVARET